MTKNCNKKAVFLDLHTVDQDDLDLSTLQSVTQFWCFEKLANSPFAVEVVADCNIIVSNKVIISDEVMSQCKHLELICVAATGVNNVDLAAAKQRGIPVCNVRNYATASVVQHTFSLILNLVTHQNRYQRLVKQGKWNESEQFCLLDEPIWELAGKTLGIIGYGVLGRAVAAVAQAFGMKVMVSNHNVEDKDVEAVTLLELLQLSDVVSLHCPLNDRTRDIIAQPQLDIMKPSALLINTARGGLVDELALVEALENKRLGGAGFDVLSEEPPRNGNPLLELDLPNLLVSPHVAWASRESRQRLLDGIAQNIQNFINCDDFNQV